MREVLEKFDFDNTISKLDEAGLLFQVLERFKNIDLHPDKVDNPTMGTIFEELIRKFNEALNENPGEHFTPRDVVHLMVGLLLAGDAGSGESEIRRFILENDLLEALIAVPEQLFYNTGIATYIWILTNRKEPKRKGKVQLIDSSRSIRQRTSASGRSPSSGR